MDNIKMTKIWIDDVYEFFELVIYARNDRISMSIKVYAQTNHLKMFHEGTKQLLSAPFTVELGGKVELGNDNCRTDYVKFHLSANKSGAVTIIIDMKSSAEAEFNESASFMIKTDVASVDRFAKELIRLSRGGVGEEALLHI